MGRVPDPKIYIDGELDTGVQSVDPTVQHNKEPVDAITPTGEAMDDDIGNLRYPLTITYVPREGKDNHKWVRWAKARTDEHSIGIDYRDGTRDLYTKIQYTEVKPPVGKGQNAWTITGYAKHHETISSGTA